MNGLKRTHSSCQPSEMSHMYASFATKLLQNNIICDHKTMHTNFKESNPEQSEAY